MSVKIYRSYRYYYDPPPIPIRQCDWHCYHKDYDGPGDDRSGSAPSEEAIKQLIDGLIEEE